MKRPLPLWILLLWLVFLAFGGLYGGIAMLIDPSGDAMGVDVLLPLLPVPDFILPGLFLIFGMGLVLCYVRFCSFTTGYRRLSLMRASAVVKCHITLLHALLRRSSQAETSRLSVLISGIGRSKHCLCRTESSHSAILSQLPSLDADALAQRVQPGFPHRGLAIFLFCGWFWQPAGLDRANCSPRSWLGRARSPWTLHDAVHTSGWTWQSSSRRRS
jgi:hypothetical protein